MDIFFRTHALDDAVFSLAMASELLEKTASDPMCWKWVIIVMHNTAQSFMAYALAGSDGVGVIKDYTEDQRRVRQYRERQINKLPHIMNFSDLYQRIKDPGYMCRLWRAEAFSATKDIDDAIEWLTEERNKLMHYFPNLFLSIYVPDLLHAIRACADVIEFLCFRSGNVLWWPVDTPLQQKTRETLSTIHQRLTLIESELPQEEDETE